MGGRALLEILLSQTALGAEAEKSAAAELTQEGARKNSGSSIQR